MKKWAIFALTTLIISIISTFSSQCVSAEELDVTVTYKVQKGDSLYKIAKRSNNTLETLMKVNKLSSDKLVVGQVIEAPVKSKEVFTNLTGMSYEQVVAGFVGTSKQQGKTPLYQVRKGDTIDLISKKLKVNTKNIMDANPEIKDPNLIFIGQKIRVPQN